MRVLLIDNYDSFAYNLAQYLGQCGAEVRTVRNDRITLSEIASDPPGAIVLSPGPGNPGTRPACLGVGRAVLSRCERVPLLGVCLGHQALGAACGARVKPARRLMHGKTSRVTHDGRGLFAGLENPLVVGRYHSLVLDEKTLPARLEVSARSEDGEVMAIYDRKRPRWGIQFHPESILTPRGLTLLQSFLSLAQGAR